MLVIGGMALGAVLGAFTALRRGGRKLDAAQYGAAYAIILGLLGLFLTIVIERSAG